MQIKINSVGIGNPAGTGRTGIEQEKEELCYIGSRSRKACETQEGSN